MLCKHWLELFEDCSSQWTFIIEESETRHQVSKKQSAIYKVPLNLNEIGSILVAHYFTFDLITIWQKCSSIMFKFWLCEQNQGPECQFMDAKSFVPMIRRIKTDNQKSVEIRVYYCCINLRFININEWAYTLTYYHLQLSVAAEFTIKLNQGYALLQITRRHKWEDLVHIPPGKILDIFLNKEKHTNMLHVLPK